MRLTGEGASIFVGTPGLTPEILRMAADKSGIHLFTRTDCNVYANGPFLVLHGSQDGELRINTGRTEPIIDLMTSTTVGEGPDWSLNLTRGKTMVLKIGENRK